MRILPIFAPLLIASHLLCAEDTSKEELLAPVLKGLVLVGDQKSLDKHGLEHVEGFHIFDVSDPGEVEKLREIVECNFLGHPLHPKELSEIKECLNAFYANQGKQSHIVLVSGQDLSEGVLHFVAANTHEGDLAVADEALPKMPTPPPPAPCLEDQIMIPCLHGIVLIGNPKEVKYEGFMHLDGIFVVDVNIPGGAQCLREAITCDFIGKPLTQRRLKELKQCLLEYFKARRMPVVAIQVPEQDITQGVVQLLVIQGKLGKVTAVGNCYTSSCRLENYIRLQPGDDIDENIIIADLSFMNRNPFRRTDAVYTPGAFPGTTNIELLTEDRRPFRLYVGAENTGVKATDELRLLAGFNWGNVFGFDHVFSYQYTASPDFHKFQAHTIQYSAPLPSRHILVVFGGVSFVHPKVTKGIRSHGYGVQGSLRYDIPLKPTQHYLHELSLGFDFKRTNNTVEFSEGPIIFGSNVNLTQLVIGYNAAWERLSTKTSLDGEIFWSPGKWLSDQSNKDFQTLRTYAKNNYIYGKLGLTHNIKVFNGYSLSILGRGQVSSRNLLPSEEFGLGGYDSVRGYDEREENADNAILLSGELKTPVLHVLNRVNCKYKDELQLLVFVDYGLGGSHRRTPGEAASQYLIGAGPGMRYMITPYLSARLDWGIKLHKKKSLGHANSRIHFAVVGSF